MANPNLFNITTLNGKFKGAHLNTTSDTVILTVPSNHLYKITNISVSGGTSTATVTVYDSSAADDYNVTNAISIPGATTVTIIDKDSVIYLEEGDELRAWAGNLNQLDIIVSYEDMS